MKWSGKCTYFGINPCNRCGQFSLIMAREPYFHEQFENSSSPCGSTIFMHEHPPHGCGDISAVITPVSTKFFAKELKGSAGLNSRVGDTCCPWIGFASSMSIDSGGSLRQSCWWVD